MTPRWVGVLICLRVERLCRGIWTGWIDGPRPTQLYEVHQGQVLGPALLSQQLHATLPDRLQTCLVEKDLRVLGDSWLNKCQQCA